MPSITKKDFKPFVGRCFELKNYTDLKKYPPVILIMDEDKNSVMFLDNTGTATWIKKFYLRNSPIESRVFATTDTLSRTMTLIERMRTMLIEGPLSNDKKQSTQLSSDCSQMFLELRDLANRTQSVNFAPPMQLNKQE